MNSLLKMCIVLSLVFALGACAPKKNDQKNEKSQNVEAVTIDKNKKVKTAAPGQDEVKKEPVKVEDKKETTPKTKENSNKPTTKKDKVSYSIGMDIGSNFKRQEIDVNMEYLLKGLNDGISGNTELMTEKERTDTMRLFQMEMMKKQQEIKQREGKKNLETGAAFLEANAKKDGVITTESGLQYKIIKPGTGTIPTPENRVLCHYTGTLIDGTKFDSSVDRGKPAEFAVKGVIKGWTEALQLMKEGAQWELYIPSNLAYGERGSGNKIGPNKTLIFQIELIEVKAAKVPMAPKKPMVPKKPIKPKKPMAPKTPIQIQ